MRIRWIVAILVIVCVACWAWPYAGAYSLTRAVEQRDPAALAERINFPALRRSLSRQVVDAYLRQSGRDKKLGRFGRGMAMAVGTSVADPYLKDLLTPETLIGLLGDGRLKPLTVDNRTITFDQNLPRLPDIFSQQISSVVFNSYYDGLADFLFNVTAKETATEPYGIHVRLAGLTWRLAGVDLPPSLLDRIAADILAREKDEKKS